MDKNSPSIQKSSLLLLTGLFFISGFTALLYQVVWQRMLGLFSGSDVHSVSIVVASYLLGLGLGSWMGGWLSDRVSSRKAVQIYGLCNLGIALFAVSSRFLFYDLLFRQLGPWIESPAWTLAIVFLSLLIPTVLMGLSLPLLSKAVSRHAAKAAPRIGLLYGVNTLGSGLGTLIGGWYIIGTLGYERTVYLGAALNALIGLIALSLAATFPAHASQSSSEDRPIVSSPKTSSRLLWEWSVLVFLSGFAAISLEILWFRILETLLQSIAYTYAHLLSFILVSNALGSVIGAAIVQKIRHPRPVFLWIQAGVIAYSVSAIWLLSLYWQAHPVDFRVDIGYIDLKNINSTILFRYLVLPFVMLVPANLLLGFYVPLVQKAVQTDDRQIGQRVGLIQVANILGNTTGSLITGLVLLDRIGTAGTLRGLTLLGLGFVAIAFRSLLPKRAPLPPQPLTSNQRTTRRLITTGLAIGLLGIALFFPNNTRLWAAFHGINPKHYFIVAEDSTGIAAITEANQQGILLASGQAQANFPYLQVHALLGSIPPLLHPNPAQVLIIGLGSGGTAHTIGVNPATQQVEVIELLQAELTVLRQYAQTAVGRPLRYLFQDPRYRFVVNDGRQALSHIDRQFDIIETDAIHPWRSRAGMLYSQEFFQMVQSHLAPGGLFVEWNVGPQIEQTLRHVFPYVASLNLGHDLYTLIGSDHPIDFNREALLTKLELPSVVDFLEKAEVNVAAIRQDIKAASVTLFSHQKDGQPPAANTDLFPQSEYYLNQPLNF